MNVACLLAKLQEIKDKNRILACVPCVFNHYVSKIDFDKDCVILYTSFNSNNAYSLRNLAIQLINLEVEPRIVLLNALGQMYDIVEIDSISPTIILKTALHI